MSLEGLGMQNLKRQTGLGMQYCECRKQPDVINELIRASKNFESLKMYMNMSATLPQHSYRFHEIGTQTSSSKEEVQCANHLQQKQHLRLQLTKDIRNLKSL